MLFLFMCENLADFWIYVVFTCIDGFYFICSTRQHRHSTVQVRQVEQALRFVPIFILFHFQKKGLFPFQNLYFQFLVTIYIDEFF